MECEYIVLRRGTFYDKIYYDLIEIVVDFTKFSENFIKLSNRYYVSELIDEFNDPVNPVFHIPVSILINELEKNYNYEHIFRFLLKLPRKYRDDSFFTCPRCGKKSFYAGLCRDCSVTVYDEEPGFVERYNNYTSIKDKVKSKFIADLIYIGSPKKLSYLTDIYYVYSNKTRW